MINKEIFKDDIEKAKNIEQKLEIIDKGIKELELLKRQVLSGEIKYNIIAENNTEDNFENDIHELLINTLKCKPNLKGYSYLVEALKITY